MEKGFNMKNMKCQVCDNKLSLISGDREAYDCSKTWHDKSNKDAHMFYIVNKNRYEIVLGSILANPIFLHFLNDKVKLSVMRTDSKGRRGSVPVTELDKSIIKEYIIPKRFDELKEYIAKILNFQ